MAVTFTNLLASNDNVDRSTYTTASITPTGNELILASIGNNATVAGTPTLSGNGITWVEITNVNQNNRRVTIFRGLVSSPTTGAVTIDFAGATQTSCDWAFTQTVGADTSGTNGSGAIVQSATNGVTSDVTLTVTLAAFASASNATFGAFLHSVNEATTQGSGFTQLSDAGHTAPVIRFSTQYRVDNDTTVDASWSTAGVVAGVALEVKAAGAAPLANPSTLALMGVG